MPRREILALTLFTLLGAAECEVHKPSLTPSPINTRISPPTIVYHYDCKEGMGVPPAAHPWVFDDKKRMYVELSFLQFQANRDRERVKIAFNSPFFTGKAQKKDGTHFIGNFCQTDWDLEGPDESIAATYLLVK